MFFQHAVFDFRGALHSLDLLLLLLCLPPLNLDLPSFLFLTHRRLILRLRTRPDEAPPHLQLLVKSPDAMKVYFAVLRNLTLSHCSISQKMARARQSLDIKENQQEKMNQQLTMPPVSHVNLSDLHPNDTSICHCLRNRTASHKTPTQPHTATSDIRSSHRIPQSSLPRLIQALLRWPFIHHPSSGATTSNPCICLCPCRPFASAFASPINHQQVPQTFHSVLTFFLK